MRKKTTLLVFLASVILIAGASTLDRPVSVSADGNPGASGHGTFNGGSKGGVMTFSFNARVQQDGYVTGEAEMHDLDDDSKIHIEINCISFGGSKKGSNIATLSGPIKNATDASLIGAVGVFTVVDNGEGANDPPDGISSLIISGKECLDCRSSKAFSTVPTVNGNIQVRQGEPSCPEGLSYCSSLGRCYDPRIEKCPL